MSQVSHDTTAGSELRGDLSLIGVPILVEDALKVGHSLVLRLQGVAAALIPRMHKRMLRFVCTWAWYLDLTLKINHG